MAINTIRPIQQTPVAMPFNTLSALTHISPVSFLWGTCTQCRPRSDTAERGAYQGLHGLLTECSFKILIKMINTKKQPLKWKLHGPMD